MKDTIVCFDDFERKGEQLTAKEILGLISILKDQRNCKITIILNDESLKGNSLEDYHIYREKVVDIEIGFLPSAEECADLVFTTDSPSDQIGWQKVVKLNIKNIRILQRIKRLIDGIWPDLNQCEERLPTKLFIPLFSWRGRFIAGRGMHLPSNTSRILDIVFGGWVPEKEIPEQEKRWDAVLRDYNYQTTDELDIEVSNYIQRGFYFKELLKEKLQAQNAKVRAEKGGNSLTEAWRLYFDSFNDNASELVSVLSERLRANTGYVSPVNLHGAVRLLRELGHNQLADELIDIYVASNTFRPKLFLLDSYPFRGDFTDE